MAARAVHHLLQQVPQIEAILRTRQAMPDHLWLVGGCVRDLLLARPPCDIDLASPHPEPAARYFADLVGGHVVPLDMINGLWRVACRGNGFVDFCRLRADDITHDLCLRDFTINSLAIVLPKAEEIATLLDPLHGVDDLRDGVLRMCYAQAMQDDPARILRAYRFMAELQMTPDKPTVVTIQREAASLALVAPERLLCEWWKLCAGRDAALAIERMDQDGTMVTLFPELRATNSTAQQQLHHRDVWQHMLLTMRKMAELQQHPQLACPSLPSECAALLTDTHRCARLLFLALIHDMGKDEGAENLHTSQHDHIGAAMAEQLCRRMRMSREDMRVISEVIRLHPRPLSLLEAQQQHELAETTLIQFLDDCGTETPEVMLLAIADNCAGHELATEENIGERLCSLYDIIWKLYHERYCPAIEHPLLTGQDLLQELHMKPGRHIRTILRQARDLQISGALTNHAAALAWASAMHATDAPEPV